MSSLLGEKPVRRVGEVAARDGPCTGEREAGAGTCRLKCSAWKLSRAVRNPQAKSMGAGPRLWGTGPSQEPCRATTE